MLCYMTAFVSEWEEGDIVNPARYKIGSKSKMVELVYCIGYGYVSMEVCGGRRKLDYWCFLFYAHDGLYGWTNGRLRCR